MYRLLNISVRFKCFVVLSHFHAARSLILRTFFHGFFGGELLLLLTFRLQLTACLRVDSYHLIGDSDQEFYYNEKFNKPTVIFL